MPDRATVTQITDIGVETTENTAVATLTRPSRSSLEIEPNINFEELRRMGYRFGSDANVGRKWSGLKLAGKPAYDEMSWWLDMLIDGVSPSTPGGATNARLRTYTPSSVREMSPRTVTARQGDTFRAMQAAGCFLAGIGISFDQDKVDLSGVGFGRKITDNVQMSTNEVQTLTVTGSPTGGTFTLTVVNPQTGESATTAAIAYNASAATVQAALEALSNIDVGEVVAGGGALPGTPVTIEFRKRFGATNVALMTANSASLTGGTSPTVTPSTTTPGATATETEGVVVEANHIKVYADTASGSLGGTALTRVFSGNLQLNNWRQPFWTVNRDNAGSMAGRVPVPIDATLQLTLEGDDAGMLFYTQADDNNNPFWFIRWEAVGGLIESGQSYTLQFDLACKVKALTPLKDVGGVYGYDVTFGVYHNSGWGKSMQAFAKSGVATVS